MNDVRAIEILIVEDNPGDVLLLRKAFERSKIVNRLTVASDGEQALELLRRWVDEGRRLPELVLLDINLPRVSGLEVLEFIKAHDALKHLPVVMLTSSDNPRDVQGAYARHANAYLTKPPTLEGLMQAVAQLEHYWFVVVKRPMSR
jgi:CheY-like chemotaxis protein